MKKMNVIAVTIATVIGGTAMAAPAKAVSKKNKISNKVISTKAAKSAAPASASTQVAAASDQVTSSSSSATSVSMPVTGTTTVNAAAVQPAAAKSNPFRVAANFYYYGSSLSEPGRQYQTDQSSMQGYAGSPVQLDTHIVLGYKLTNNLTLSLNPYFISYGNYREAITNDDGEVTGYKAKEGKPFELSFPYIKLGVGQFYKSGSFKWNGDFRVYPGISDDMHGLPIYLRTGQNFTYGLTDKLTLGAYTTLRYYKYTDAEYVKNPRKRDFRMTAVFGPEYQLTDTVGLAAQYVVDFYHPNNAGLGFREWQDTADGSYAEVGVSWDINKMVNFNPYVDFYLQRPKFYNTMIGANLAFNIL